MPRANRYFTPGYIWHVTHRCHDRAFLLKFSCDRDAYKTLLYEVRRRYGLCVLNYMITNNHIHMLVADTGDDRISKSMQFVAGQIAQDYNRRRGRSGSFWEDRYHATAVDTQEYLWRCMLYIDFNMVRAGAVTHPSQWKYCGYNELVNPLTRYRVIDVDKIISYFGFKERDRFIAEYKSLVDAEIESGNYRKRDSRWSESVAVGNDAFLEGIKGVLRSRVKERSIKRMDGLSVLEEPQSHYGSLFSGETGALMGENSYLWRLD